MHQEWRPIEEFMGYSVSDVGQVRKDRFEKEMALSTNQIGIVNVGLTKDGRQYRRSVNLLVAKAFLEIPHSSFDSVINLNGDRFNNSYTNLVWRPRWFAFKYNKQFNEPIYDNYFPIEEQDTGQRFYNPWEAAKTFGLIRREVVIAVMSKDRVWPTRQRFGTVSFTR